MNARILLTQDLRRVEGDHATVAPPLMERAGAAAAKLALDMLASTSAPPLLIAGPGNNGGDAFVVARLLREAGREPVVLFASDPERLPADAQQALTDWLACGGCCIQDFPDTPCGLIIDGLFGIGLTRPIEGQYAEWIARINASPAPVLALDIPSGLNADTGATVGPTTGPCVQADQTVTFIALKPGLLTADGPDHCGKINLCDLGIDLDNAGGECITIELFKGGLKPRRYNSHKGSFGNVAIIGGAPGMAGAALLAGRAALALGSGRVYLGMLEPLPVDFEQPELMLRPAHEALAMATVVAIGPGLGQSGNAHELLARCIETQSPPRPLVIDADALNLLATDQALAARLPVLPAPTFFTPHPAEAARLLGLTTAKVQSDRLVAAKTLANRFNAYIALKGCGTIIVAPDGRWYINTSGNPGLASAGSGDVLTGMLAALLAQGWPPLEALLAAVHLHGLAADACIGEGHGPIGLTAGEIILPTRRILNNWIRHSEA